MDKKDIKKPKSTKPIDNSKPKKSEAGKGDAPRPFSNYEKFLKNWDDIFDFGETYIEPIDPIKYEHTRVCSHCIDNNTLICKYCGKSKSEILASGESWYQN